ncbi:MAG: N-acetyl-gamma-glutamyl-phosphate reductase [Coprobacillaceae bacterium]
MINIGIVGATGYGGSELVRFLLNHKEANIVWVSSRTYEGEAFSSVYPSYFTLLDQACVEERLEEYLDSIDVVFFATPQGVCAKTINDKVLEKVKVIDLSADYRLQDSSVYKEWYGITHASPELLSKAVYGLSEIERDKIKNTKLLANPGCYTTCSILTIYPLIKYNLIDEKTIVIDAKSGVSGAGRGAKTSSLYCEVNESMKAYGVTTHRHTPEIEEQLGYIHNDIITLTFTPHLVPMNRGILVTAYAQLKDTVTSEMIDDAYKMYQRESFIRILPKGKLPETRFVRGSNYVDINYVIDKRTNRIIMIGAIDNLVKGAAGQAIQNMNIMFGIKETEGLEIAPLIL